MDIKEIQKNAQDVFLTEFKTFNVDYFALNKIRLGEAALGDVVIYALGVSGAKKDLDMAFQIIQMQMNPKDSETFVALSVLNFLKGDIANGVECLERASDMNNKTAIFRLALARYMGLAGLKPEIMKAGYNKLAELAQKGNVASKYFVAVNKLLKDSPYTQPNVEEGQKLLKESIKEGCKYSLFELSYQSFVLGAQKSEDVSEHFKKIDKAATLLEPRALLISAGIYLDGVVVPQNVVRAKEYVRILNALQYEPVIEFVKNPVVEKLLKNN